MVASFSKLSSASATTSYYEKDGYYASNDPEHRRASFWYGKGAVELGLANDPAISNRMRTVATDDFKQVLEGFVPGTDQHLGHVRDGTHKHVPGFDITLSAPKSVSLAGLLSGDKRVIAAHRDAVIKTIDYIESKFLQTRIHDLATGKKPRLNTPHMVAAVFEHIASRNLDPQIHSHVVTANMTRHIDGHAPDMWRSVEPTAIRRNEKLIGAFYRNELAKELLRMGYQLTPVQLGKMQSFEIVGYDKDLRDAFSTRRQEILDYIDDRGLEYSPRVAQQAALITRQGKEEPDRSTMHAQWHERLVELQMDGIGRAVVKPRHSPSRNQPSMEDKTTTADAAITWTLEHLEERKTVFTRSEILAIALTQTPGETEVSLLESQLQLCEQTGRVIAGADHRGNDVFTTNRTLAIEKDILIRLENSRGRSGPVLSLTQPVIAAALAPSNLTSGQQNAVQNILTSNDQIIGIQGVAGSGKTRMLESVVVLTNDDRARGKIDVLGLAPTASAARSLHDEASIPASTLQSFLMRHRDVSTANQQFTNSILVVDEASLASAVQMRDLLRITERLNFARVVLVGDSKQLNAVGAGAPFRLMQYAGMETVRIEYIVRQRNLELRQAVKEASLGRPETALEILHEHVHGVGKSGLCREAADRWLSLYDSKRDGTMVIAPMRHQRDEINETIRDVLVEEGKISGPQITVTHLDSYRMTRAQKQDISNYQAGDVVVFAVDSNRAKLKANDIYFVQGRRQNNPDDGLVRLIDSQGSHKNFNPIGGHNKRLDIASRLDVYEPVEMILQAGDKIRWTRNDNERGLLNAHCATISAIGENGKTDQIDTPNVTMKTDDGRVLKMAADDQQLSHCDYAYSSTVHAAQGKTTDHVIAVLDADHAALSNQKMFYVEISRARDEVTLITDNRLQLADSLMMNSGEQISAL